MKRLPSIYIFYLSLAVSCLGIHVFGGTTLDIFEYQREAIMEGQWWRLFSNHFAHLGWYHLLVNLLGIGLIVTVIQPEQSSKYEAYTLIFTALFVSLGLLFFAKDLNQYVGLSGVLHGLFIVAMMTSNLYTRMVKAIVLMIIALKMGWEFSSYFDPEESYDLLGGRVESRAHLLGVIAAMIWLLFFHLKRRYIS